MTPPVTDIVVGQTVTFKRGGATLSGVVTAIGRSIAHVKVGDDFFGYRTFVENLKILKSSQRQEIDQ